jgi:hypothetical protein
MAAGNRFAELVDLDGFCFVAGVVASVPSDSL